MSSTAWTPGKYPPTRRSDHVDVYQSATSGEIRVPDPYRWLEEYSDETDTWTASQELLTRSYLDSNPDRQRLEDAFRASMNYAKFSAPTLTDNGYWYWFYNSGLQAQAVLYRSKEPKLPDFSKEDSDNVVGDVFFDPNVLAADGTASLTTSKLSRCGKYFAYALSLAGSDFATIYVRSTTSPLSQARRDAGVEDDRFPDEIKNVKFSTITWTTDSKGFFYQRLPAHDDGRDMIATASDKDAMLYYHKVGTGQSDDILIYQDKEHPEWMWSVETSEDGKYVYLYVFQDTSKKNLLWVAEPGENGVSSEIRWRKVINKFEHEYRVITNDGSLLYLKTNMDAPQRKVITIDLTKDTPEIHDLIAEEKNANLVQVNCAFRDYLVVIRKRDVKDEIYLYSKNGVRLSRLAPDFIGAATIINREKQSHFFVTMTGFNTPGIIARYDFTASEEQRWSIFRVTKIDGLNPDDFESRQVWYDGKDGVKVPMFVVRHKSTKFDGTASAIQYGYGGFGISVDPFFSSTILAFMQIYGAILVVPNIRGGGEFGEEWHQSGIRHKKGTGVDDFISATEFLVKNKYVGTGKVAINGASNGGLLVSACVNRAPEGTFGAAVPEVGVSDLLRFSQFTIGKAWTSEYGDPNVPDDFGTLYALSPLHNIPKNKVLPPTLLMTADRDDRVVPMHSFKHAAMLQHILPQNPHPLLLRVDRKTGHGLGKATEKRIQDAADKWGFVAQSMGLVWSENA